MNNCPVCKNGLLPVKLACCSCGLSMEGEFKVSRLARLRGEHQKLAEAFILSGGNLKEMASGMNISYPTLRKRIDDMIDALAHLRNKDEKEIQIILDRIEKGEIRAEEGMRLIKEMSNE